MVNHLQSAVYPRMFMALPRLQRLEPFQTLRQAPAQEEQEEAVHPKGFPLRVVTQVDAEVWAVEEQEDDTEDNPLMAAHQDHLDNLYPNNSNNLTHWGKLIPGHNTLT